MTTFAPRHLAGLQRHPNLKGIAGFADSRLVGLTAILIVGIQAQTRISVGLTAVSAELEGRLHVCAVVVGIQPIPGFDADLTR